MANIKTQNYWAIFDFAMYGNRERLQGQKLEALYRLIQSKGTPIDAPKNDKINGIKALNISPVESIALIRKGSENSFYPCTISSVLLTTLTTAK